ncbi:MAG: ABC transporter ATP-binding protein, partial [Candidatus Gastranaerophilales bacterium]|nr:ABC transporter ATP-binding protein [Candidatus Gastranaerophilales bacterium]
TELRKLRGTKIALIPQDPMTSLNPLYTIGNQLLEVIRKDKTITTQEAEQKAIEVLSMVKIPNPTEKLSVYPHELSGGMKQRVIIAMALATNADIIIADEPTTALDVTIQAQIMKILNDIKSNTGTSILLISHDLGLVGEYADEISVMYSGRIVENARTKEFFTNTLHPYSKALLKALPANCTEKNLQTINGQPPNIQEQIEGCRFSPRCEICDKNICNIVPELRNIYQNHFAACHKV